MRLSNFSLQVRPIAEDEMFKVMRSGKRQKKQWKRMVTKPTFVGPGFTRKPPKYERFIRPSGVSFSDSFSFYPSLITQKILDRLFFILGYKCISHIKIPSQNALKDY